MTINYAILGLLSCKPLTGYDLKKIIQATSFMPWSGNNNQIYKALLELADQNLVISETQHQEGAPSKKIYRITEAGLAELKKWSQSQSEIFETKKSFLIQLAWTNSLSDQELQELLFRYEEEIKGQILMEKNKAETGFFSQGRTPRETMIWDLINENIISSYETELAWIAKVKQTLFQYPGGESLSGIHSASEQIKEKTNMTYQIIEKNNRRYIWLDKNGAPVETEQDAIALFTVCIENNINLLLIDGSRLSDNFLNLRTGLAGIAMQKFVQYHIAAATVLEEERIKGRFKEFLTESNQSNVFRSFSDFREAEQWLLVQNQ